jgi:DNA-binding CsgD family transcriptional regulator
LAGPLDPTPLALGTLVEAAWLAAMNHVDEYRTTLAVRAVEFPRTEPTAEVHANRCRARGLLAASSRDHHDTLRLWGEALAAYQVLGDPLRQVQLLGTIAHLEGLLGRDEEGLTHATVAMRICDAHGERFERFEIRAAQGHLLWRVGRFGEARDVLRENLEHAPTLRTTGVAHTLVTAARICASLGEHRDAAVLRGAISAMLEDLGHRAHTPYSGDKAASETHLRAALGDADYEAAYEQGRTMTLPEVVAFACGRPTSRSTSSPSSRDVDPGANQGQDTVLSRREREVADLVARGLSNHEIASRLVISQRTVEGHVAKVMGKLGFHTRAQIAAWVTPQSERRRS